MELVIVVIAFVIDTVLGGFVLSRMWGWFAVPVFGLPSLNIIQALGLFMLIEYVVKSPNVASRHDLKPEMDLFERALNATGHSVMWSIFTFVFGWVVHQFM